MTTSEGEKSPSRSLGYPMIHDVTPKNAAILAGKIQPELQAEFNRPDLSVGYGADPLSSTFVFRIQAEPLPGKEIEDAARAKLEQLTDARLNIGRLGRVVAG